MSEGVKLDKSNIEDILPLTSTQDGMLFYYLKNKGTEEYHEQLILDLSGEIDSENIKRAWEAVTANNEMLRTVYRWDKLDHPVQIVLKEHKIPFKEFDLSKAKGNEKSRALEKIITDDKKEEIDLSTAPLRITLCMLKENNCKMIISNHHILYDGWSNGIILDEFMQSYEAIANGKVPSKISKVKFKEFIKYNRALSMKMQSEYWKGYFEGYNYEKQLIIALKNKAKLTKHYQYSFDIELCTKIKEYAKKEKVTASAVLYCAWGILLHRYSGLNDIVFGTTVSGRNSLNKDYSKVVGLFINTVPIRIKLNKDTKFSKLVQEVEQGLIEREEFESTPLVEIRKSSGIRNDEDILETIVAVENYPLDIDKHNRGKLKVNSYDILESTNYNLALGISLFDNIILNFDYNQNEIEDNFISSMGSHFENIISSIMSCGDISLSEIEMLSEKEKKKLLYEFNDTYVEYPKDKTIYELFEEQAEKTPDKIAIADKDKQLTYKEINEKANCLAGYLRENGVGPDVIVGIAVERSLESIVGILAVLKAGGAYLPIEPSYPKERIEYILKDSTAKILIAKKDLIKEIEFSGKFIDVNKDEYYRGNSNNPECINKMSDLAYIIYTSGSTGKPKGVMVEHKNVIRLVKNNKFIKFASGDRILQTGALTFDASTFEIWGALLNGLELYIEKKEKLLNGFELEKVIKENKITIMWLTVSLFNQLATENENIFEGLRYLLVGGDVLNPYYINKIRRKYSNLNVINGYGPTENTTFSTCFTIDREYRESIPIGTPISNSTAYIVGRNNELAPIGVYGELWVGGDGVARGYLNNPELTKQKFIDNPFVSSGRIYRTGDLARWLPDGNIEFLGRIDNQVKIRGFRIELGEIESQLLKIDGIKEAIVLDKKDESSNKYLCAYIAGKKEFNISELRQRLTKELPDYMIPSYFIQLEKMPLTPNGKIDKKALPEPEGKINTGVEYEAPRNELEEKLVKIWSEVLKVDGIGINDNFFELGGHSLKATSMISKIHKELEVEVPIREVFKNPTIKGISEYIGKTTESSIYSSIKKVEEKEYYKASSAQKRLYTLQQMDLEGTGYNMPGVIQIEGKLNVEKLEKSFNRLIERHEALRTSFEVIDGEIVQKVHKETFIDIEKYEHQISDKKEEEKEYIEYTIRSFVRCFELSKAPLIRVGLVKLGEEKYILLFDMHHIISDGVSMTILTDEFAKLYDGQELEKLRIQYKDYAAWQNDMLSSEVMKKQEEYWVNTFNDEVPVLNMPTDYTRPVLQSFEGASIEFKLDKVITDKLKEITKETGSTMYMVLLAVYNVLLSKYTGQEDIIVGSPIAGRPHADLEGIIGMFVNTLVMRSYPEANKTFREFLGEVKESSLRAYENQDYQFEELVEKLKLKRDLGRNPLFDVMFAMQNMNGAEQDIKELKIKPYKVENKVSKFDLTLSAAEAGKNGEEIFCNLEYSTKLFKKETIQRLAEHFKNILKSIAENINVKINEIDMISEREKQQLLYEFNIAYENSSKDKTLHELFEEQVEKTPNNIAVIFENKKLSYKDLNERANSLARALRENGVGPDIIVGIIVERSLEMIVGILAVLKAGGAYLPIDPNYPEERIKFMLDDSKVNILLVQNDFKEKLAFDQKVIDVGEEKIYKNSCSNLENISSTNDLAYVIYTSGSTGKPKGVAITNKGVTSAIISQQKVFHMSEDQRMLQFANITFDVSVLEIFTTLLKGAELYIPLKDTINNIESMREYLIKNKITIAVFPPPYLINIENRNDLYFRVLITGGSETNKELVSRWKDSTKYINAYGPTEISICATTWEYDEKEEGRQVIPIGKPLSNSKVYIFNKDKKLQPIGVPGELCIAGDGLARGYLNRPELTAEKFVENPFISGERMYRSGDLARWLPDGNIEFLGRIDNQVKIRGFRIELGEVESQLLKIEGIKEAIVLDKKDENSNKYLCAYITGEKALNTSELRQKLAKELPDYMIPSYFIQLEKMPLTPNGKIDKKALPEPEGKINTGVEYEAPRNELEEKLVKIWSEVLKIDGIGINDNFFELGGHSLKATSMVSKIHKELEVEVPIREVFKSSTIKGMAGYIEKTAETSIYSSKKKVEEKEYYKTSSAQKRLYTLQQIDLEGTGYNMPGVIQIEGKLEEEKVKKSFNRLIERHEALRTSFEVIDGEIVQKVHKEAFIDIEKYEYQISDKKEEKEYIENIIKSFVRCFELSKAPLIRVGLVKVEEERYFLMVDMHHIISDGVSMTILTDEFAKLYDGQELEKLRIQYKDYAAWQNDMLSSEVMKKQEEYWVNRFNDDVPVLNMPTDYIRPVLQSFEGANIGFRLDEEIVNRLKEIAKETGSTMYMVLLAAYNVLLAKYTGQEDIIVGSPIAGRPHADFEDLIGMFVNTLVMRNYPEANKTFREFLGEVKENSLRAYENQDYQFEELVEKLKLKRDLSRNPLFDVMFAMENMDKAEQNICELKIKPYEVDNKVAKFDFTLSATELEENILCDLQYCTKLFKEETAKRMAMHFKNILKDICKSIDVKISEINIVSEEEKQQLLYEFNNAYEYSPKDRILHELFEEQVEKTPNNIAIIFEGKQLSYKELNERANSLARTLRENGVGPDIIVGIMVERSLEMIVGILAVLKAGGAYLPIDPNYPEERIKFMLDDSKVNILLVQNDFKEKLAFDQKVIDVGEEKIYKNSCSNLENINSTNDLAYVIYTSGSTGKPKGVAITNKGVTSAIISQQKAFYMSEDQRMLQFANITFDVSVLEIFTALLKGAELYIPLKDTINNIESMREYLIKNKITITLLPPPYLINIENRNDLYFRVLITGGSETNKELVSRWKDSTKYINAYGPTEISICATTWEYDEKEEGRQVIPIGKPLSNSKVYIFNKDKKLQPIGVPGELCIAGDGLARGYLNRPELTAEKFVENPFISGERMYRSGDLARWLPDGNIEFLGRIDNQVKIRGFRIELGEVESQLLKIEGIKEAIVLDKKDESSNKYLCAYIAGEKEFNTSELRQKLAKELPDYMIPSYFIQLEKMPLTLNGKIDRKALPEPEGKINTGVEYEAPRNELEEKLVKIWSEVLKVDGIGINDNFFELGGHSLKATSLVSKIHKEVKVGVPIREVFKNPTIKGMSEYIEKTAGSSIYSSIKKVEEKEYYKASSAQKRLYTLQQINLEGTGYNMPGIIQIEGKLEEEKLENSFNKLIERHEALRTSFEVIDGEIVQKVHKEAFIDIEKYEYQISDKKEEKEYIENIIKSFVRCFELSKAPLIRVGLIRLEEEKYILLFDMHHIISDGVSMTILTEEFAKLYDGQELEKLRIQYKDYAVWQNDMLNSEVMKKQEEYWVNRFSDDVPVLNMPTDYIRPVLQSFEGSSFEFELDKEITNKLKGITKETGSTMYMVLLAAYNVLLAKYTGQEDIIVGSPIAGRPHADLEGIIGMFVNTLVMRNYPETNKTFREFLGEVKENSLRAYENQDYQFEELVEKLKLKRDLGRNPLFDVMFAMENMDKAEQNICELKIKPYGVDNKVSKFDMTLSATEMGENIFCDLQYCTKLFKEETIQRLVEHFKNILKSIAENINVRINEIDMISEREKKQLLYEFNYTYAEYPKNKTINELFEEQVERSPYNIAVAFQDKELTYKELNDRANCLAIHLRELGIKAGSIVGIMVERSVELIIGIMGVLKAGGGYLPIETSYPRERVKYILHDSGAKMLLMDGKLTEEDIVKLEFKGKIENLKNQELYSEDKKINLKRINKPEDLAYVIYTSGSTGKPKGVQINNKSIVNFLYSVIENYDNEVSNKDTCLSLTNVMFDVSVFEIFLPLVTGAKLDIYHISSTFDIVDLAKYIISRDITLAYIPPTLLSEVYDYIKRTDKQIKLNKLLVGVEPIREEILNKYMTLNKEMKILNGYGPTETTICATMLKYSKKQTGFSETQNKIVSIGKPLNNTKLYILNGNRNLQPIGVPGEICISGDGLARGYLNRPELTAEKFIENPFISGERMYRTGDLAKWLPDGNIEFLGRIDNQVKVRGFRIELGEIESQLLKIEGIKEAIVLDKKDESSNKYLCAYIAGEKEFNTSEIRQKLAKELPDYMIPSYFIQLEKMPLTPNGKIDRKSLPEPEGKINTGVEYEAPRNELEEKLVKIWSEVLNVDGIGINDNFFELGGHSLKATIMVSKIYKILNVEIPLKEIFKVPTIKGMSEYIRCCKESETDKIEYKPIEAIEEKEYYEASSAQKRLYTIQQLDLASTGYNMLSIMRISGKLDLNRFEQVFNNIIARHEAFRTSFDIIDGRIVQRIAKNIDFKVKYVNCSKVEDIAIDNLVKQFIKPFDLSKAPLFRTEVVKVKEDEYILLVDMHHIISDGTSIAIFTKEFMDLYGGRELDKLRIQYKDYAAWQNKQLSSDEMKKQEQYWIGRFSDEIPVLNMPYDYARPTIQSNEGSNIAFSIDKNLAGRLNKLRKETESTMYMILLSAFNIMLSKYSGQEDIVVGSPIAGRSHAELQNIIGMFVNTLAMRNYPQGSKSFAEFLKEVKEVSLSAYENQNYQFEELVDKLKLRRDLSRNPLFDVMFAMQNMDNVEISIDELTLKPYNYASNISKFDLSLFAVEEDEEIKFEIEYCTKLFKKETIEIMIIHLKNILEEITKNINIKISEIEMLSEEEKKTILSDFNNNYLDYQKNKTMHELFEEQVEKSPDNIALVLEGKTLTYRELNEKSNQLAVYLREKGLKQNEPVGIMVERSPEMIIAVLGIIKAGGACLPIDSEYPIKRIEYILDDSKANMLIVGEEVSEELNFTNTIININDTAIYSEEAHTLQNVNEADDLLYIIYTSGTTGKPKGVMVKHRTMNNLVAFQKHKTNIDFSKKVLQFTNLTFDVSFQEIFTTLLNGGELCLINKNIKNDINKLFETIEKNEIEVLFLPTAFLKFIFNESKYVNEFPKTVKHIVTAGEQLIISDLLKTYIRQNNVYLHNHYGPSETHVVTTYTINPEDNIEDIPIIGKPISNSRIYILNENKKLQPIGVAGELYIAGEILAKGYLNNLALTAEKFIDDPFMFGEKMYKTGDLARWLPDGNIEFLGRIDNQVKIRGFRIELGEIENQLLKIEGITEAIVLDKQDESSNKYLCAYIAGKEEFSTSELRRKLAKELPDYMIPSYFIQLEKMPLTPNGKIDRKALPEPEGKINTGVEYEAPRNELEEKLVGIWIEVLKVDGIGINDDFFELGGHSLKATSLVSKIHKELEVEVPIREVFKNPTIKGMSEYIGKTAESSIYSSIKKVEEKEYYKASSAQKRLYTLQQMDLRGIGYNMPGVLQIEGKLEEKKLEKSFNRLIERHEALRTSFEVIDGEIVQKVHKEAFIDIEKYEYRVLDKKEEEKEYIEDTIRSFVRCFDLSKAPLIRVGLVKLGEEKCILMFDMHHIISDGVSMTILTDEFAKLYDGQELEKLRIQYKDYTVWQNDMLNSEVMKKQEEYWVNKFSDDVPVLNMPTDYIRPVLQSFEGANLGFKLDKGITNKLKEITKETGSTMYMVLLAAYNVLLAKYTGQEDIIVGSPIAGRPHADLEGIIGMFVNTLVMRNYPETNKAFRELLGEVKESSLRAYENQDYQFEELVEKLKLKRDLSRNPLFDVMFVMQNMNGAEQDIDIKELKIKPYKTENKVSKFDLTLTAAEAGKNGEEIFCNLEYSTKLFKEETIQRLAEQFKNILKNIAENINVRIKEIDMISEKEKKQLLYEFNDTYADYPTDKTIQELFEEQVEKTPDNVAVVFEDKQLTYRELNEKANALAKCLREKGVKSDSIVGMLVEPSMEMIIGIIAILKSGGAYLPINPEYPEDRIAYTLKDSNTNILLIQKNFIGKLNFDGEIICLEDENIYLKRSKNLEIINTPRDMAYIIYTSGTTGKPKGVIIEHRNVVRLMFNNKFKFDFSQKDVWTMFHSYCFDFSVWEMYGALLYGGRLVLVSKDTAKNAAEYLCLLKKEKVTVLNQIPTPFYNLMREELSCGDKELKLRYVIFGGEALKPEMLSEWVNKYPQTKLINMYGITETTVHVTYKEIGEDEINNKISNIGRPIPTLTTYVLDKNLKLQPIGIPGELCVGGEGVARGYLNRKELTEERFIINPYKAEEKIYRSGDLVRMLSNGEMEYLGRIDHQVKIRGFRIELGEIENQLLKIYGVKEVIVLDKLDENGDKYLCAYVVGEREYNTAEFRAELAKELPDYMIPSYFIQLEKMPLTLNGKIDREALPKPDGKINTGVEYEAPKNELEEKLVKIWSEVLKVQGIGINDNFFELGGHSLKATQIVSMIYRDLNIQISLNNFFSAPTIARLYDLIKNSKSSGYREIEALQKQEYYELSYAQNRLWIINNLHPDSIAYNMPGRITLYEKVDREIIKKVFDVLIRRHEGLRTRFGKIEGIPVQIIDEVIDNQIAFDDISELKEIEKSERREQLYIELATKIFNLQTGPLMYIKLIKVKEGEYDLIYSMHHIISDGMSMEILKKEFSLLYDSFKQGLEYKLEPLRVQYKDFAAWQNKIIKDKENVCVARDFWHEQLSGQIHPLELPTSYDHRNLKNYNSAGYRIIIKDSCKNKLKAMAREHNTSLFVVMVTTLQFFLSDLRKQQDILIGTAGFGRTHSDLKNVVGYFVNTTILRTIVNAEESFNDLLNRVSVNTLSALEYQYYPIELVLDELSISYPKISVFFNMLNMGESNSEYIENLNAYHIEKVQDVKFDMVWYATEYANGIQIICNYLLGLFKPSLIEYIMDRYVKLLDAILENPNKALKEYNSINKKRRI